LRRRLAWVAVFVALWARVWAGEAAAPTDLDVLAAALAKPVAMIQGRVPALTATLTGRYRDGALDQSVELTLVRADADHFALALRSSLLSFVLRRDAKSTVLSIPTQGVAFRGRGPAPADSDLQPGRLLSRMAAGWPVALTAIGVMQSADAATVALMLHMLLQLERQADARVPTFATRKAGKGATALIELAADGKSVRRLVWRKDGREATLGIALSEKAEMPPTPEQAGVRTIEVPRAELERMLGRGLARAAHILAYNQNPSRARSDVRRHGVGELRIRKGRRLAMLQGTPYEVGFQHGKLLRREARRLADTVLYVVGLYYSVSQKKWYLDVMRGAFRRLKPHIPAEYLEEMQGLADGSGMPLEEVQLANVFPALFHCSGFAVFGKATAGGTLYHGRVLDYMTEVGLQRDAVVFVVRKKGAIPFANAGYAGFVGSVSGMNAEQVAFGEMGGRGEGLWDGTPMPILMRMGLERARSLAEAMRIFREAKRTCEYYYVISDGKIPSAVGVGATPESIEFIKPGQAHPKLPTPVEDTVLLSAGSRYGELAKRVREQFGRIDEQAALALMRRPVAMRSNLHDVLFVPQQLVFHVADARGREPACDQPYVRYDLKAVLAELDRFLAERR